MEMNDFTDKSATHFCSQCGALWLCSADGTWQLRSESAGENCCNNKPMHGNKHLVSVRHALQSIANICGAMSITRDACQWAQDGDSDTWATGCRHYFTLNEGGPCENDMAYCCYCGRTLIEMPWTDADAALAQEKKG